ncbi:MAG: phosphoenolpyruvate--protein phosphotransferase [Gammaproteobacteria bacterium TMED119]|nr:MAG: phosphoenolpyruvate--protein phosphotransferase [Gammaproteobacteria bacterium TMED119]RCL47274.1 MAG: phosphoenolpyruvate--protein phosphotransferase [Candidatus Thioglobus sp.]|tara:strand:+ start:7744 stop:9483 length:1740 start_codon:yes stop_codon:yes gene_type:complete
MSLIISGLGVSKGIAIGNVHVLHRNSLEVYERQIAASEIKHEISRFNSAVKRASKQLKKIQNSIPADAPKDIAAFIESHLLMLDDAMLSSAPIDIIKEDRCNAEWALKLQRDKLIAVFDLMEDEYLRTRQDDIDHVISLIQKMLFDHQYEVEKEIKTLRGSIIVADDLTPADTVILQHQNIAGFITELGGPLSHTAIIARSLSIPAIVGIQDARQLLNSNEQIIIDGGEGMVLAGVDDKVVRHYKGKRKAQKDERRKLESLRDVVAQTQDGIDIDLQANIELTDDIKALKHSGAMGVGLYRTEFLYIDRDEPASESEQLSAYKKVIRALKGLPVTIRTLDLGAEKEFDPKYKGPMVQNPALGLRGLRRSLKDTELFKCQLRAILQASIHGPVRIMFPMITSEDELAASYKVLAQAKQELTDEGKQFDAQIPIGIMIEVPAAALLAQRFANQCDFLSIGTNDLIQYSLAIDRIDESVNYLYDPLHPAVLKLIKITLQAGAKANIPVAMCGEMAGDPRYTRLLLGMGLRHFSSHPATVLEIKAIINSSRLDRLDTPVKKILSIATSPAKIHTLVDELNNTM